jgi:hypothetical protein
MATLTITVLCVVDHNNKKWQCLILCLVFQVSHYVKCPYVEYNYVIFLIVIMLSVIFLIVTMLSIIFMSVLSWLSS